MEQKEHDLVSVIMPSYNAAGLIKRTIESVVAQSYKNWELLVIDDCSSDNTRDVVTMLARSDSRIRLVSLSKNNGAPAAPRNIGIRKAKGEWIAFLDADDIWHPRKLSLQLEMMRTIGVEFSCTQMCDFTHEDEIFFCDTSRILVEEIDFNKQRLRARIPTSSVVASRDLLLKVPFNEDPRYKAVEDYHCWLRVHQEIIKSIKLKCQLLYYRKVPGQISGSKKYMLGRVYMVHKEYHDGSFAKAVFYTVTHSLGGFYFRILKKGL